MFHMFHTGLARNRSLFAITQRLPDSSDIPIGTGARRRVLGLPPHGEVVPGSPLAAGFSR